MTANTQRIFFISQSASPIGGVETWLDHICRAVAAAGWDPLVGLVKGSVAHEPARFRRYHPDLATTEIDGCGLNAEGRVRAVMRMIERVAPSVCVPLTVVDAHEAVCRAKAAGARVRYVQTIRGNVTAQIADAWRHAPWADLVVCPGALTAKLMIAGGVPADRVRHIPNGARQPDRPRSPRERGAPIRLAFVGRLAGGEKRVEDLPRLLDTLVGRGVSFTMTVAGDGPLRPALESAVTERKLGERVEFTGRLSQDELYARVYPAADVLVLFSESEAFGIALVEAMMHGVVPVSSRYLGCRSEGFLCDGETGFTFDVGDVEAAADTIQRLALDEKLLRAMSARAAAGVGKTYTWDACMQSWIRALEECDGLAERTARALPPRPDAAPVGRLDRLGCPPGAIDFLRRVRIRMFGVPTAQIGGEEWPFVHRSHDAARLAEVDRMIRRLDNAEKG